MKVSVPRGTGGARGGVKTIKGWEELETIEGWIELKVLRLTCNYRHELMRTQFE